MVKVLVALGWLWPLVIAGAAAASMGVVGDHSDRTIELLIVVCFAGVPVVVGSLLRWLPGDWPEGVRWVAALFVAVVVLAGELFLAALIYTFGLYWWDYIPA